MNKVDMWPPPEWEEVVVMWDKMLQSKTHNPNTILDWIDNYPGGDYHLHGYRSTEGFAFRFKRPEDATVFKLKWL